MAIKQNRIRKILTNKMRQMHDIIADIDGLLTEMETDFYRVCIFGSARIGTDSKVYAQVEELAEALAKRGADIVTGGGPGLMEAANKGARAGSSGAWSIGLPIDLPFENDANSHLDVKSQHRRFSSRLDEFMRISHAVVLVPGGIGTLLELFYTWQLIQVEHIKPRPVLLLGPPKMWDEFLTWMKNWPLAMEMMSEKDFEKLHVVSDVGAIIEFLEPDIKQFRKDALAAAASSSPSVSSSGETTD